MAYDEGLAQRIREVTGGDELTEKKMFGGLCFLKNGNMACGIIGDELMVRVGKEAYAECLALPHAREMNFTGRVSKGMVYVGADGLVGDGDLAEWVGRGVGYASGLPAK